MNVVDKDAKRSTSRLGILAVSGSHVDWSITQACNFSCHYCHASSTTPKGKLPAEILSETLQGLGQNWTITISGGEPLIHPDFVRSCEILSQVHDLRINTNLSRIEVLKEFKKKVNLKRVKAFDVSLHIEERLKYKDGVREFIQNVHYLKELEIPFVVNYVLHPSLISRVAQDIAFFIDHDIRLVPKRFKGLWMGQSYPEAYNENELSFMQDYFQLSSNKTDYDFLGIGCRAGMNLIKVKANGECYRCPGDKTPLGYLGNLNQKTLRPLKEATPCNVSACPCWGPENVVLSEIDESFLKGIDAYITGDLKEATERFEWMIKKDAKASHAYHNLGIIAWKNGNWEQAHSYLTQACHLVPGQGTYSGNLAIVSYIFGHEKEALSLMSSHPLRHEIFWDQIHTRMQNHQAISTHLELSVQFRPRPTANPKTFKELGARKVWDYLLTNSVTKNSVQKFSRGSLGQTLLRQWRGIEKQVTL